MYRINVIFVAWAHSDVNFILNINYYILRIFTSRYNVEHIIIINNYPEKFHHTPSQSFISKKVSYYLLNMYYLLAHNILVHYTAYREYC